MRAALAGACLGSGVILAIACGPDFEEDDEFLTDESGLAAPVPPGAVVVAVDADAHVRSGAYASQNFGGERLLDIDRDAKKSSTQAYLRFKVPANVRVGRATVHLYARNGSSNAADVHSLPDAVWTESGITWNNKPTAPGALVATLNRVGRGRWVEVDVTAAVVPGQDLNLALLPRSNDNVALSSKESQSAPALVIEPDVLPDGGAMCEDGGMDAGEPAPVDAGTPVPEPVDAGSPMPSPVDAGTPTPMPVDAGMPQPPPTRLSVDVQPIFDARCINCHGATTMFAGLNLSAGVAHSQLVNVPTGCNPATARVKPGDPMNSQLWLKLADHANKCGGPMPFSPGLKLMAPSEFAVIEKWILEGALDN